MAKDSRHKGIGKRLVEEVKNHAKNLSINTVSLFVLAKNSNAIQAYTNMGFETEGIKMNLELK